MTRVVDNNSLNKIRIRAVDASGEPLKGMQVELVKVGPDRTSARKKLDSEVVEGAVALRSLSTSRDGFAIFSLDTLPVAARAGDGLAVRFAQRAELTFPLDGNALRAGANYLPYTIPRGPWSELGPVPGTWVDAGLELADVWAIPGLFPDLGDLVFGDDRCGRLVPNDRTVRIVNHNQIVRTAKNVITCLKEGEDPCPGCAGPIEQGTSGRDRELRLHEGEMLQYEIRSTRLGHTFGDLLYSLPLAPCESVTLAISHWEQKQAARAELDSESGEKRNATYYRDNALSEAMNAASSSNRHGWGATKGFTTGGGGSASGSYSTWLFKGAASLQSTSGVSASGTYDRARFAASSTRHFSDRIQQSAEAWRRDHQVVVMEQTESEDQQISYRTVCNNNHCHVLNLFYHEVLDNFRITTKLLGHREVYLVPYKVKPFDLPLALCKRPILLPFLIDDGLSECYSKLKLAGAEAAETTIDHFKIDIKIAHARNLFPGAFSLVIHSKTSGQRDFSIPYSGVWQDGQSYSFLVNTPDFAPSDIHSIGIIKRVSIGGGFGGSSNFGSLELESFTISAKDPGSGQWVVVGAGGPQPPDDDTLIAVVLASYKPSAPSAVAADRECAERLLAHLNCNKAYYNALLWLLEDPNERFCRFDSITCGPGGVTLAELVVNEPVAVQGCYVAFPKAAGDYVPYPDEPIVDERLLTLPTPGIFADAALGQCSACETIDRERYWNWKDSPCVCGATAVTLKTPTDSALISAGTSPFVTLPTAVWAAMAGPPANEGAFTNSLVTAFGAALASAMLSGQDSTAELDALKDLLGKLTDALADLQPDPGSGAGTGAGTGAGPGNAPG